MLTEFMLVAIGGALGALARYLSASALQFLFSQKFPFGTLLVNCIGSFFVGLIMSVVMGRLAFGAEHWRLFLIVGFLGAYTTFSSYAWETMMLYSDGQWLSALGNVLINNVGALILVIAGLHMGRLLGGS